MTEPMINRSKPKTDDAFIHRFKASSTGFQPSTLEEKTRSLDVVAATESPSSVYDPARYEVIDEVLLMSGVQIPESRSIPLTVEHDRSAGAVIGSLRDMRVEGDKLTGRVFFSEAEDATPYFIKVREGHLDSFSITYPASGRDSVYIAEGETSVVNGRSYAGPMLVTKSWAPKSLGLVLYPADENAKARHQPNTQQKEKVEMNKKLRALLERHGLSKDATEEEALAYLGKMSPEDIESVTRAKTKETQPPATEPKTVDVDVIRKQAAGVERERIAAIDGVCDKFDVVDVAQRNKWIAESASIEDVNREVLRMMMNKAEKEKTPGHQPATIMLDERDKFRSAATDALVIRAGCGVIEKPAPGALDLAGYSLVELARQALRVSNQSFGGDIRGMVGRAMTTSDFPYLLANTANKALFAGWEGSEETWPVWVDDSGTVSDFKTNSAPRVSEASDLDEVKEDAEYKYGKRTEAKEEYQIATYGKLYAISRQAVINDDLNALTDQPKQHGEACARKLGDIAYAVLTANAAMGDGVALFHANHANYIASGAGAAPGVTTVGAAILAMGIQKDLQGLRRLNIRPQFFIATRTLEAAAEVFFNSLQFSDHSTVATDSSFASTRNNPYAGPYFKRVYEARLDDAVTTGWYLAASKGRTVRMFFLNGVKTPYMETKQGWTVDGVEYKVRIDAGAKAMDYRGLYYNYGA